MTTPADIAGTPSGARAGRTPLPHQVSTAPFDPYSVERMSAEQERYYLASQWQMMWWKFRRHRVAVASGAFLLLCYLAILVAEFLSPYALQTRHVDFIYAPPQMVRFFHDGEFVGPFVYGLDYRLNMQNLKREYTEDRSRIEPIRFFCRADKYRFWGLFESDIHLACPSEGGTLFLLGTDRLGRDLFSRIIYGARISLTIGLIGVAVSFALGLGLGGLAGYYGGWTDAAMQRVIEIVRSIPHIPLWLALSAIMPVTWSPILVYFGITLILGLLEWTGLARAVRSKLLALREEDFCLAAELMGARPRRIIWRHLIPSFMSHLIASATLAIPSMILGETALSFLGLGLRAPITSWGVLLNEAQNINVVALYPWLMFPVLPVILVVLSFNFLGDGLRDAADPYK
jgi:peptide/nickel transport system permease protein